MSNRIEEQTKTQNNDEQMKTEINPSHESAFVCKETEEGKKKRKRKAWRSKKRAANQGEQRKTAQVYVLGSTFMGMIVAGCPHPQQPQQDATKIPPTLAQEE